MNLTNIPLNAFLAHSGTTVAPNPMSMEDSIIAPGTGLSFPILKSYSGYTVVDLGDGDVAVVDQSGNEAGFYTSNSLIVHAKHRGQGLAVALVLYAYKTRLTLPSSRELSDGGKQALTAAWEVANGKRNSPWWP